MANGFIDGATITSALTYLNLGRNASRPKWHQMSMLEATYLMLHDNIRIIPRPRGTGGEHGDYAIVASECRELIVDSSRRREVLAATFAVANQNYQLIKTAWKHSQKDPDFLSWAELQRYDRWQNQVLTYGNLFDRESISMISEVAGYEAREVLRIYKESADPNTVVRWIHTVDHAEDAKIANAGWIIGGFMRGFFYDNLAAAEGLQLLSHPFRSIAQNPLEVREQYEVTNSEEAVVKILIGNALTERTRQGRVTTWATTVKKARDYIHTAKPDLRNKTQREAEDCAIQVARKIDLQGGPRDLRWALDFGLQTGVSLVGFSLSSWVGLLTSGIGARLGMLTYKLAFNKTPGEQIGDLLLKSNYQFRWLARSIPGRIERTLSPA